MIISVPFLGYITVISASKHCSSNNFQMSFFLSKELPQSLVAGKESVMFHLLIFSTFLSRTISKLASRKTIVEEASKDNVNKQQSRYKLCSANLYLLLLLLLSVMILLDLTYQQLLMMYRYFLRLLFPGANESCRSFLR